jgi:hypothetical protein
LAALEFDLRSLSLLGRNSTTWAMSSALFCFSYFSDRVSHFCPELALDYSPPTCASNIAGITDTQKHAPNIGWDVVSLGFCLGWPQTANLPVSISWVADVTGVYHHAWPLEKIIWKQHFLLERVGKIAPPLAGDFYFL